MKAIALDVGNADHGIKEATEELDKELTSYKIPHFFEVYEGDNLSHIADRIETQVVPFFSGTERRKDGMVLSRPGYEHAVFCGGDEIEMSESDQDGD